VDAACSGAPGKLEYRGVNTETGEEIFHAGPYAEGTNNVGEFLAIVHALTWQAKHNMHVPVYSDSENAILWVNTGICKTNLKHTPKNAVLFAIIRSAENWLAENELPEDKIIKWDTGLWGENPCGFWTQVINIHKTCQVLKIPALRQKLDDEIIGLVLVAWAFAGGGYSLSFFRVI
jgi:ribonuclease HI